MARFDVYRLKTDQALAMDIQADLLDRLETRIVIPLLCIDDFAEPVMRLNPRVAIDGTVYHLITHMMGSIPVKEIAGTVGNLSAQYDEIVSAVDLLFQGF
ncbi:MAG: CcdB family protein [Neorhizobium sp.]|nr:CcdB family protein [Neorhizobium sp.]